MSTNSKFKKECHDAKHKRISQVTNYIRKKTHILFMIFVFVSNSGVQHVLIISVTWRVSSKKQELLILREHINSLQFFVLSYNVSLLSKFHVVVSVTISASKRYSVRLYFQFVEGGLMSYLCYLLLVAHSGVQHILCCAFALFVFVLCTLCCQFLWILHFDCPFGIL